MFCSLTHPQEQTQRMQRLIQLTAQQMLWMWLGLVHSLYQVHSGYTHN